MTKKTKLTNHAFLSYKKRFGNQTKKVFLKRFEDSFQLLIEENIKYSYLGNILFVSKIENEQNVILTVYEKKRSKFRYK
jgi:hypothetical protein